MTSPKQHLVYLPRQFCVDGKIHDNPVVQLLRPEYYDIADTSEVKVGRTSGVAVEAGGVTTIVLPRKPTNSPQCDRTLLASSGNILTDHGDFAAGKRGARWLSPRPVDLGAMTPAEAERRCELVRTSWIDQFRFREEQLDPGGIVPGLRPPQIGALYATLAHWKVTSEPATIVMPTGTGKTETMLAILLQQRLPRLLVTVPTVALRDQIVTKFVTLGLLKPFGVVGSGAHFPVVATLRHRPRNPDEVDDIFLRANVVVTTMNIVAGCDEAVTERIAQSVSNFFIDEAHHIPARTWHEFRRKLANKPIVQFTATPFRSDGKHVDGRVIFSYPLRKAQEEGYFTKISFRPVTEYSPAAADEKIASEAVAQLDADIGNSLDHLIMARVDGILRAQKVHSIYERIASRHSPMVIHSALPTKERDDALGALRSRSTRIIVCVDMLGEGFDLPELKIAALHDPHRSLAVTLQFTGRFTRAKRTLGDATMIANIADQSMDSNLRELYAEDADWNFIIQQLSTGATKRHVKRSDFLNDFVDSPTTIPLQNVFPKMSALVYHTKCADWVPDGIWNVESSERVFAGPTLNHKSRVLIFVTRETEDVPWGELKEIQNVEWHLYMLHWSKDQGLLFINTSNGKGSHEALARAVVGDDAELIRGEKVFRTLHGVNRLTLMNLGLSHTISRAVRFSMHVGTDIGPALTEAQTANKLKSNLFGSGYENAARITAGCSQKGRIWSYKIAYDMTDWIEWCHAVGGKLLDDNISTRMIFENLVTPEIVGDRPALVPLVIDWPEGLLLRGEQHVRLNIAGEGVLLYEAGIELLDHEMSGPIRFRVKGPTRSAEYEVKFSKSRVDYVPVGQDTVAIHAGTKEKTLTDWFQEDCPVIYFSEGSFLRYNEFCSIRRPPGQQPFLASRLIAWDWTGVDLTKESQTYQRHPDSIQRRVIEELTSGRFGPDYDIVFDDDDTGEIADVVAIKAERDSLLVDLFHCKFSKSKDPGARVKDLYEVCGQAQKCVFWRGVVGQMLGRLPMRDDGRMKLHSVSRFEKGDLKLLSTIRNKHELLTPQFRIFIVQPGLSKASAEPSHLELLAATELYLKETFLLELNVITSQ